MSCLSPSYRVSVPSAPPIQPIPIDPISPHLFTVLSTPFFPYFLYALLHISSAIYPGLGLSTHEGKDGSHDTSTHLWLFPPSRHLRLPPLTPDLLPLCILTAFFNGFTVSFSCSFIFSFSNPLLSLLSSLRKRTTHLVSHRLDPTSLRLSRSLITS